MRKAPSSTPLHLRLIGEAAKNSDARMSAAGDRALQLAQKAMREGKAGPITEGENLVTVEK